jgi:hypothetical protein
MPKNFKVKKAGIGAVIKQIFNQLGATGKRDLPEQYYNMNLTAPQVKSMGIPQVQGLDINVMDASKVKTMKSGGSVEIGKGKDYIKDLL